MMRLQDRGSQEISSGDTNSDLLLPGSQSGLRFIRGVHGQTPLTKDSLPVIKLGELVGHQIITCLSG
jgi:hypothetical protein